MKRPKEEAEIDQNRAFRAPVVDFSGDRGEKRVREDALGSNAPYARVCTRARFVLAAKWRVFKPRWTSVIFLEKPVFLGERAL